MTDYFGEFFGKFLLFSIILFLTFILFDFFGRIRDFFTYRTPTLGRGRRKPSKWL